MKWVFPLLRGVTPRYYLPARVSPCARFGRFSNHVTNSTVVFPSALPLSGAMSRYPLPLLGLVIAGGSPPPPQVLFMVGVFPQGFSSLPSFSDNS